MVTFISYVNVSGLCVSVITFFFLNILTPAFVPFVSLVYVKFSCYVCRYIFHLAQFYLHLSVCSLNVKGLGNSLKRGEFSNCLSKKKYSIYLLQEGHCSKKTNPFWSAEQGYKTIFSGNASNQGGVAILSRIILLVLT